MYGSFKFPSNYYFHYHNNKHFNFKEKKDRQIDRWKANLWEKVISADYIVNYELLSTGMTSSEARLKTLSNKVRIVLFCPVLL